jgi:hypothetical protein
MTDEENSTHEEEHSDDYDKDQYLDVQSSFTLEEMDHIVQCSIYNTQLSLFGTIKLPKISMWSNLTIANKDQ